MGCLEQCCNLDNQAGSSSRGQTRFLDDRRTLAQRRMCRGACCEALHLDKYPASSTGMRPPRGFTVADVFDKRRWNIFLVSEFCSADLLCSAGRDSAMLIYYDPPRRQTPCPAVSTEWPKHSAYWSATGLCRWPLRRDIMLPALVIPSQETIV